MRSVKIERPARGNPRAQAGRKPARTVRKKSTPKPAARREPAGDDDEGIFTRAAAKARAFATHPILLTSAGLLALTLIAALLAGGYIGRTVRDVRNGADTLTADAGFGISDIHINGYRRTPYESVLAALDMQPGQSIFGADLPGAWRRLSRLPWVASVDVMRRYPDAIYVTITEKRPFALWQAPDGSVSVVERNGRIITSEGLESFAKLPRLAGDGAPQTAADLVDAVQAHRAVNARIAAYVRRSDRRFDLVLDDGVVVKLPEKDWPQEIDALEHLIIDKAILEKDLSEIDLRSPTHFFFVLKSGEKKDVERGKET